MNFKQLEEQLMELAEQMGGGELVEEFLMDKETITQNPEQNETEQNKTGTDFFEAKGRVLDVELIRVRMKECNLTLKQVQEQVGVSYRTVTRIRDSDN